jgi:hypothetical protein
LTGLKQRPILSGARGGHTEPGGDGDGRAIRVGTGVVVTLSVCAETVLTQMKLSVANREWKIPSEERS